MTKTAAISTMILNNIANGMAPRDAFDAVLGAGRFEQLAGDVWEALRA